MAPVGEPPAAWRLRPQSVEVRLELLHVSEPIDVSGRRMCHRRPLRRGGSSISRGWDWPLPRPVWEQVRAEAAHVLAEAQRGFPGAFVEVKRFRNKAEEEIMFPFAQEDVSMPLYAYQPVLTFTLEDADVVGDVSIRATGIVTHSAPIEDKPADDASHGSSDQSSGPRSTAAQDGGAAAPSVQQPISRPVPNFLLEEGRGLSLSRAASLDAPEKIVGAHLDLNALARLGTEDYANDSPAHGHPPGLAGAPSSGAAAPAPLGLPSGDSAFSQWSAWPMPFAPPTTGDQWLPGTGPMGWMPQMPRSETASTQAPGESATSISVARGSTGGSTLSGLGDPAEDQILEAAGEGSRREAPAALVVTAPIARSHSDAS